MSNIDQVSSQLGKLTAEAEASQNQRTLLFEQTKQTHDMVAELTTFMKETKVAHDIRMGVLEDVQISQGVVISDLKKFKQRMLIGIAGIAGTGGITGAIMTGLMNKLGLG